MESLTVTGTDKSVPLDSPSLITTLTFVFPEARPVTDTLLPLALAVAMAVLATEKVYWLEGERTVGVVPFVQTPPHQVSVYLLTWKLALPPTFTARLVGLTSYL